MASKTKSRANTDAAAVARMIAAQENDDTDTVLTAPEPVEPEPQPQALASIETPEFDPGKVDGRTLRRTGREPFATRIKPETHEALRRISFYQKITIAEALELAVAAYKPT